MSGRAILHSVGRIWTVFAVCAVLILAGGGKEAAGQNLVDDRADSVRQALASGLYEEAEQAAREWSDKVAASKGPESIEAAQALDLFVDVLVQNARANAPSTLELAERALGAKERVLGPAHVETASSLSGLGAVYVARGQYSEALPLYQRALSIRQGHLQAGSAVADCLDALAFISIRREQFRDAEQRLQQSLRIRERSGDSPVALARTFELLGLLHRTAGRYNEALTALDRARVLRSESDPDNPETVSAIQMRGEVQYFTGDIAAARRTWAMGLAICQRTLRADHPATILMLLRLATGASAFGDLREAQRLRRQAMQLGESVFGPCQREAVSLLNDAAISAKNNGDYAEARRLYQRAANILDECRKIGPSNVRNDSFATLALNQGTLASLMGDLPGTERYYRRAIQLWTAGFGPNHPFIADALDGLGTALFDGGDYARAIATYERSLKLRRSTVGADHPDVAWTLTSAAQAAADAGNDAAALSRINEAVAIYERSGGSSDPDHFALVLVLRGTLESRRGDFVAARKSFADALSIRERVFGANHPLSAEARANIASADFAQGSPGDAVRGALDAERDGRDHLRHTVRYLPEREGMTYAAKRPRGLDLALSIATAGEAPLQAIFDEVIQSRGVVLDELANRSRSAASLDPQLSSLNETLLSARQRFANLMLRSLLGKENVPRALLDQAQQEKELAEQALAERSAAVQVELQRARAGFPEVRSALPPGTALVSFVRYNRSTVVKTASRTLLRTTPAYLAFVIRPDRPDISIVSLGSATPLEQAINDWRLQVAGGTVVEARRSEAERAYREAAAQVRKALWDPVASSVKGSTHVLVVPDGAVNLVSFAALSTADGRYLLETGPVIHYVSEERDLVAGGEASTGHGLLAVGGAAFDRSAAPSASARRAGCAGVGPLRFTDLPGTRLEVEELARIWASAHDAPGTVFSGRAAGETAVKRALAGHEVVHLATHGFFLGAACGARPSTRAVGGLASTSGVGASGMDNPLLLAGLALTGANRASVPAGEDDGILTAEEIAGLSLQGTQWAVLSACDTGIGEIRAGEGVFGLRRAFQIAGVRTTIMSLWSVDDQATRGWMRALYEGRFQRKLNTADAVREASLQVLQSRRASGQATHPFYWGAFVAAGDWR